MLEFISKLKVQLSLITIICILLNFNTLSLKYALDDEIIIHQNLNVQAGFKGIGKILSTDALQGYLDMVDAQSPLTGGRFRPLSIITFAIEQSLFGETYGLEYREAQSQLTYLENSGGSTNEVNNQIQVLQEIKNKMLETTLKLAPIRHCFQLIFFITSMFVLLLFLRKHIFNIHPFFAFLTVLLFISHPVHTEVIANIKSRDEILSLLFIILTLHFSFNYIENKSNRNLLFLSICFIMALLSKEYALILPIIIVVGWLSLFKIKQKEVFNTAFFTMIATLGIFILIRFGLFSNANSTNKITDVLNDPYLYATPIESFASKVAILIEYVRILFYPISLSSDYSYSHFSYIGINNWKFLTATILYIGLAFSFFYSLKKRFEIAFPLALILGFLALINNLLFSIGATMGERLIYHSSMGLCIIILLFGEKMYYRIMINEGLKRVLFLLFFLPVFFLFSFKTINRNKDWESNYTLFMKDVTTVPNSAIANNNAGTEIYNKAFSAFSKYKNPSISEKNNFKKKLVIAISYFDKTLLIHDRYVVAYMNRGLCHFKLGNRLSAGKDWVKASSLFNGIHPFLKQNSFTFFQEGLALGNKREYKKAVIPLEVASKMNPNDASIWNNLGGSYFMSGQFKLAYESFDKALTLNPTLNDAFNGKKTAEAIYNLEEKLIANPQDNSTRNELQIAYKSCRIANEFLRIKL